MARLYARSELRHHLLLQPGQVCHVMDSIYDTPGWKQHVVDSGLIHEPRNIALALSADGFNPWDKRKSYSLWPITACVLNLPEHVRYKYNNMLLLGLIDGPSEPRRMATYLEPIVKQLNELHHGVLFHDPLKEELFVARARLLFTCADYPGHGKLNGQQTSGKSGCIKCHITVCNWVVVHVRCFVCTNPPHHHITHERNQKLLIVTISN